MKVKALIAFLSKFDSEAEILIQDGCIGVEEIHYISEGAE
jgi:hypothetical protein|tara:strand:+ start:444 stop:563 length:120 start_codon:yes stop_codon:yes gene_type:complete